MTHHFLRIALLTVYAVAFSAAAPNTASAAEVSCETFNPCTVGVCLEDGTCEASPGNNGAACDTFNDCTVGTCADGECAATPANNGDPCETFDYCVEKDGQCTNGECVADPLPNGAACRADVLGPCFTGTCTKIANFSFCTPVAKCGGFGNLCEFNCNLTTGACEPTPTHVCEKACTTGTCVPDGEFEYTCTNVQNRPNNTLCEDGSTCTSNDKCQSGDCVGSVSTGGQECGDGTVDAPEQCDDGDDVFATGDYCDDDCTLVPCGKPTRSSGVPPKTSDALFILKTAVKLVTCDLAVCDVNSSGTVTTADALIALKKAVGLAITLNCPPANAGGA